MKKKKTLILSLILVLLALCGLYLFFVPYVEYREPELPPLFSSRLTRPKSSVFYLVGKEGGILSHFKTPSLIVYSPLSEVNEESIKTLQWGRSDSKALYSISFSKNDMYIAALEANKDKRIGFLYDENDSEAGDLFFSLFSLYPNLVAVPYFDRVSVVNKNEILESLRSLWGVIVYDAENSREAWSETHIKVIMDGVSAASAVSIERVMAITPDWGEIISDALKGDDISFDYTLTVLEN